ncbi:hypothetical protein V2J09_021996 [Rumex salicifolius]
MYSDRLQYAAKRSITDRLNGNTVDDVVRRSLVTGKRQRQDDNWKQNLFDDKPQLSRSKASKLSEQDLRLKLQRRSTQQAPDLREKLTGSTHAQAAQALNLDLPKPKPVPEASKPTKISVTGEAPVLKLRKVVSAAFKKSKIKADTSIDGFLRSLGLEKYQIQFQAEEVDMAALEHITDEDLKAMGIPMGPRKKILSAMASKT